MDGITTGLAFLAGLGLPQVLLWVLTFAVVFAVLTKAKVFGRAPAALVSVVAGIFVLMAVPNALVAVIGAMSTGLLVVATGILVFISFLEVVGLKYMVKNEQGISVPSPHSWVHGHTTLMAAIVIVLAAIVFFVSGGATLVGIGIPAFGWGTWLLILVGIAVLWMMSESPKQA
jgi:hypothetical protein